MDATYISNVEVLTLLRNPNKENLFWKWGKQENISFYEESLKSLQSLGYKFSAFVIDGMPGLKQMLKRNYPNAPIQHCQFHQIKTIKKYLPRRVQSEAGKALRYLCLGITKKTYIQFSTCLKIWEVLYSDFLKEKSYSTDLNSKKKWWYTHKNLRSAYRSIKNNLSDLFTYEKNLSLKIPNTTNICEGYFSHLKERLNRHRGLSKERKYKMTNFLLSLDSPREKE